MTTPNGSLLHNVSAPQDGEAAVLYRGINGFGITWSYFVMHLALLFVACVGVLFNSVAVYALSAKTQTIDVSRIFILNLACSDIITDVTCIYVIFYNLFHYKDYYECAIRSGMVTCVNLNSAMHLLSLTFDRYFKISFPYRYVHVFREQWAKKYCACVWVFCGLLSALPILGWRQAAVHGYAYCSYFGVMSRTYILFIAILFMLTFAFMLFCYGNIWIIAVKQSGRVAGSTSAQTFSPRETSLWWRPTKTVLTLVLIYTCCWLPFGVVALLHLTDTFPSSLNNDQKGVVAAYCSFFVFLNTIANPIIYVRRIRAVRLKIISMFLSPYGRLYNKYVASRSKVSPSKGGAVHETEGHAPSSKYNTDIVL